MFYVEEFRGKSALLRGETAQHLRKVLRAERGQRYELSDGEQLWLAAVVDFGKDQVEFELLEQLEREPPPASIHLYAALIKFDAFEWMLEKVTELGVAQITPVYSLRCDKGLDQAAEKRMERWRRILAESGQQSRRLAQPELHHPVRLEHLSPAAGCRLMLDESVGSPGLPDALGETEHYSLLCGPEGGWDDREREAMRSSGWLSVSLGTQVLRAETAAIAGIAVVMAWKIKKPRV